MPAPSPLSFITDLLQSILNSATDNKDLLRKNEAATRAALIDPVLRALGWNTADVRMVEPERTIGSELRVDYLLHDSAGKPQVVIEAKCLGSVLDKHGYVSKVLGYALGFKVQTVFITDGVHWHCYPNLHQGTPEPVFVELHQEQLLSSAMQLIQRLDAALFGHYVTAAPPATQLPTVAEAAPAPGAAPKKPKPNQHINGTSPRHDDSFVELTHLNMLQLQPNQKPKELQLPDGSVRFIKTWKDILLESCKFVLNSNPNLPIPLPDRAGKKTALFSASKPTQGASCSSTQYQGRTVFVYTNYSAKDCVANALYILSKAPSSSKKVASAVKF